MDARLFLCGSLADAARQLKWPGHHTAPSIPSQLSARSMPSTYCKRRKQLLALNSQLNGPRVLSSPGLAASELLEPPQSRQHYLTTAVNDGIKV